jgi:hypothetical protein
MRIVISHGSVFMAQARNIVASSPDIAEAATQKALEQNILAAELHEATARYHRAAAQCHRQQDDDTALEWAAKAHLGCNDAFGATIAAHKRSAGDHFR